MEGSYSNLFFNVQDALRSVSEDELDGSCRWLLESGVDDSSGGDESESLELPVPIVETENGLHFSTVLGGILVHLVEVVVAHGREAVVLGPSASYSVISLGAGLGNLND